MKAMFTVLSIALLLAASFQAKAADTTTVEFQARLAKQLSSRNNADIRNFAAQELAGGIQKEVLAAEITHQSRIQQTYKEGPNSSLNVILTQYLDLANGDVCRARIEAYSDLGPSSRKPQSYTKIVCFDKNGAVTYQTHSN